MSESSSGSASLPAFVSEVKRDFEKAFRVLKETRTLSATHTYQIYQRVPGEEKVVAIHAPDAWSDDQEARAQVVGFDGTVYQGNPKARGAGLRYADIFKENPDVNVVIHVHGPYLGAWAGAHRVLPLLYAPAQRQTLAREIPIYIDRRGGESAFINEKIRENEHTPAILEANGGATFWGKNIIDVSKYILILEEAAYFQGLAEVLGGTKDFGPGVLEQQWGMGLVAHNPLAGDSKKGDRQAA
ncbi:MAG: class II aldolase/adducin family protein [Pedobacter sp.]|nr:class II aldolase/adducin family protein [Pedobacter sp.]